MYILTDGDGVVRAIGNEVIESSEEQGVVCINGACYGLVGQKVWELENIPEHIVPDKYKYVNGEFIINENYKPHVDVETLIEQQNSTIENLNQNINLLENSIVELTQLITLLQEGGN